MSGETETQVSAWTPDTLKMLEDEKIAALKELTMSEVRRIDAREASFGDQVEQSFRQVNEFRGALDDLSKTMATRRELESLAGVVGDLRSRLDVGPAGIASLQSRADTSAGAQQGARDTRSLAIALAGLAIAGAVYIGNHQKTTPVVVTPTVTVPSTK